MKLPATLFLILISSFTWGHNADSSLRIFKRVELELQALQNKAFHSRSEKDRIEGNKEFLALWETIIKDPAILTYPFDSLKEISTLSPADKKFKLITWNLHRDDGSHHYFGFLLVNSSKKVKTGLFKSKIQNDYEHYKLVDKSMTVKSPENYIGTPDKWFGMLYLQLVECDGYYTLIGWDGNDKLTQRKFVDVLYFKSNGLPVFGKDVFKFPKKNPRRMMFEYSHEVSMSLRYIEKDHRIVYSHLASNREGTLLEGQYQYYGPDGSFDALEMHKDKWFVVEDVDARKEKEASDALWNHPHKGKRKPHKKLMPGEESKSDKGGK